MSVLDKSYVGKGRIFLNGIEVGNCSAFGIEHEEEELSQAQFKTPGGGEANSLSRVSSVGLTMTMVDFNKENLAIATRGATATEASAVVTDESITAPATLTLDTLVETAKVIDTSVAPVVTSDPAGTTYTEGTDYEVTAGGIVILAAGSISASDPLLIDYTSKTVGEVEAIAVAQSEYRLKFVGVNEAQENAPFLVTAYRVKFSLAAALALIADEFAAQEVSGKCLADSSITAANESQYYKIEVA